MAARNLSVGPVPKLVATLALPVLGTFVLQSLYALADLYFVGRLGAAALAGLGISLNTFYLILAVGQSIGTGGLALMAQAYGRGEHARVPGTFQVMFWLSAMVGLAFAVGGFLATETFIRAFTQDPEVYREGVAFFRVYSGTFFVQVLLISLSFAFRAVGDFIVPTLMMAVSVLLNVALDPLLIFGLGPIPGMGVAGAALATLLAQSVGLACYLWLVIGTRRSTLLVIRRPFFWDWRIAGNILRIGLPAALQFVLFTVSLLISFRYLRPLGGDATAAASVGFRIFQSALLPGVAIGAAVSSLVGQNYGAGLFSRVRSAMLWGILYTAIVFCLEYGLILAQPAFWVSLFAQDPGVVAVGAQYLVIMGLAMPIYGIYFIATFSFQGLGRTIAPLAGSAVRLVVIVGGMQALVYGFGLTAAGVFWVGLAAMVLEAATMGGALLILRRSVLARPDAPAPGAAPRELPPDAARPMPAAEQT